MSAFTTVSQKQVLYCQFQHLKLESDIERQMVSPVGLCPPDTACDQRARSIVQNVRVLGVTLAQENNACPAWVSFSRNFAIAKHGSPRLQMDPW